jgi:two-component system, NtrC family, sensor kinase
MGTVIVRAVEHVTALEGPERARVLVDELNGREPTTEIRWLEDVRPPSADAPTSEVRRLTAEPELVCLLPVAGGSLSPSTLRLTASLAGEEALLEASYERALVTAVVAALASMLVAYLLSWLFVSRPLRTLGILARRLGGGDLGARTGISGSDEVAALAREMNAMGTQLERTQAKLEEASAARVAVLEELRHADRLRVLGEIASELAHQIGTPLQAVRTRAQVLGGETPSAPDVKKLGEAIVADVDRVSGTVRSVLDFARRRGGAKETVDVARWADRALDVLRPLAARRQVALELRATTEAGSATFTSIEIQQVLSNVVMNALQASPEGGRVVVEVARDADAIRIEVRDRGAGIAPEALPHVFEPYFTTKRAGEGTGLGLSVAHGIVREHGGTIEISSALGEGTTVTARLPAEPVSERPPRDGKASWKARVATAVPA